MNERWRSIPGYEGSYSVSDLGRVRSEARTVHLKNGRHRTTSQRILSACLRGAGYPQVVLAGGGRKKSVEVHRLVMLAFAGPQPPGCEVRHVSPDASDARLVNLRWGTHAENMRDKVLHGTQPRGEVSHFAKLTESQARVIKIDHRAGPLVARDFGISVSHVSSIRRGSRWAHL